MFAYASSPHSAITLHEGTPMTDRAALQAQLEQGIAALGLSLPAEAVPRLRRRAAIGR